MNRPTELWMHYRLGLFFDPRNPTTEQHYHGNADSMRSRFLPAHRQLPWSWIVLVLSIILVFISIYLDVNDPTVGYKSDHWFQRSGAVLVIASLWVEWNTSRAELGGDMSRVFGDLSPSKRYVRLITAFSRLGLVCAVVGTAVWAYGDRYIS